MFIPINLRCEYQEKPIGVDVLSPRFSWMFASRERGQRQTAYRIIVASSLANLAADLGDAFDSGEILSNQSINIEYAGEKLQSGAIYFWKVCAWDKQGQTAGYSEPTSFEMGILRQEDWKTGWMGFPAGKCGKALYFRKAFQISKPVVRARAYLSSPGYCELYINGTKVGDHVLDPAPARHDKRLFYVTYNLDGLVGENNVIGIIAGNGWFGSPRLLFQLNILLADGTVEIVSSDPVSNWLVTDGPIIRNSIYDGETYDARLEKEGWNSIFRQAARGAGWRNANQLEGPGGELVSQQVEPIKVIQVIHPIKITNPGLGIYVLDLGQNISGWVRLTVHGEKGTEIVFKYAESLYDNGFVNQENLLTALAADTYILKGDGLETYQPRFTYHGFRYVEIAGYPGIPDAESIVGVVVHSAVPKTGDFFCSNRLLNQIHQCVVWTESDNLHGIPTDCPQRDERMGWLNDATVRAEEAIYNFNLARLYTKWLDDIKDAQDEKTGAIADTAPFRWGRRPGDPVDSSYLIIPWLMYLHYNDLRILEKHYAGMKKWVDFLMTQTEDNLVKYSYYGDWASPIAESVWVNGAATPVSKNTPGQLISTGYLFYDLKILSQIAGILKKPEESAAFDHLAAEVRKSFNQAFYNQTDHVYSGGSQASQAFALFLGMVSDSDVSAVLAQLVKNVVETNDNHLSTGNLCTKYLMEVLTERGREDVAYALATQTTYPSWGYMLAYGATTIWERWEYETGNGMNSHNHPMLASIGSWFYKYLAGICPDASAPGFDKINIKPCFPGDLDFVKASLQTMRGLIAVEWKKKNQLLDLLLTIPANTYAEIKLPLLYGPDQDYVVFESEAVVWKSSGSSGLTDGMISIKKEHQNFLIEVNAGTYHFLVACTMTDKSKTSEPRHQ
jgi:alpha-L-rhamnosidase